MNNLENFNNMYSNLSESAYTSRPNTFTEYQKNMGSVEFNYSTEKIDENGNIIKGGKNLHNNGIVYLQADPTLNVITEKGWFGDEKQYQKGLLTDEKAGFNAYFVTDTPILNSDTQHAYFVIRGSDAINLQNTNDWIDNNASFTLFDAHIPQAKLATTAIHEKIKDMRKYAPDATLSITAHSLGTIVSIQAVANLPEDDIFKIDKVVLFQGPDTRESINKMSLQAQKNIALLEEQGKIEYYVNAFDIVSMLNRNKKGVDEIGKVQYLLPKTFTTTFDDDSSHDFGQYQLNDDGTFEIANLKEHSYIFAAGIKISRLIDSQLDSLLSGTGWSLFGTLGRLLTLGNSIGVIYTFWKTYNQIIKEAQEEGQWQEKINNLHRRLSNTFGESSIILRKELVSLVAQKAQDIAEDYETIVLSTQKEYEDEIDQIIKEIVEGTYEIRQYLSLFEMKDMIAPFEKAKLWANGIAQQNQKEIIQYKDMLNSFRTKIILVFNNIALLDNQIGDGLFAN